jgi:hypothetical protein
LSAVVGDVRKKIMSIRSDTEVKRKENMIELPHIIVHVMIGSRTGQGPIRFRSAFGNRETMLILVGESTPGREPYSSLRTPDHLR